MCDLPRVIVGLGNPGPEYRESRHNAGFLAIDRIVQKLRAPVQESRACNSIVYESQRRGRKLVLAKPLVYMNNSGQSVQGLLRRFDVVPSEILVVYDCLDLPVGRIRLRKAGGSGGHRGIESVISELGTQSFPRLRIGIGRPDKSTVQYVLSEWTPEEREAITVVIDRAADAALLAAVRGMNMAMNACNNWVQEASSDPKKEIGN